MADFPADWSPNPWVPDLDPQNLKALGKLAEELNECGSAVARCIIQGIGESEPVTGKLNRVWLEDEIADVEANLEIVKHRFGLDRQRMAGRRTRKHLFLTRWLEMLAPGVGA